jgi:hypothetical protein
VRRNLIVGAAATLATLSGLVLPTGAQAATPPTLTLCVKGLPSHGLEPREAVTLTADGPSYVQKSFTSDGCKSADPVNAGEYTIFTDLPNRSNECFGDGICHTRTEVVRDGMGTNVIDGPSTAPFQTNVSDLKTAKNATTQITVFFDDRGRDNDNDSDRNRGRGRGQGPDCDGSSDCD